MFGSFSAFATLAALFASQTLAAPTTNETAQILPRGGGYPASNPPGVFCYNRWEKVTNDPVVQYWYVTAQDMGHAIKANRLWNHLNLNGCAPTEHVQHLKPEINGAVYTFHTSEACTAARVSHAIRSASSPPKDIACKFTQKNNGISPGGAAGAASGGANSAVLGILRGLGGLI
ncbi:uncharacterized protein PG986_010177 [Apiospora aurea]|uniref:Uncharacterized protein n=1 Tax=Apiospora aurea TaxID=335848 RepID=A0ABR1Q9S7_9PEZI